MDDDSGSDALEKIRELYTSEEDMNSRLIWSCAGGAIESVFSHEDKTKYSIVRFI